MCNIPLISSLIIAAQVSFALAIGFFTTASTQNGDIFHAWQSPISIGLGVVALFGTAGSIASLTLAARAAAKCFGGGCDGLTAKLVADIAGLIAAIGALTVLIVGATALAAIPFAATAAISGILVAMASAGLIFIVLDVDLAALSGCATKSTSSLGAVIRALTVLLIVGIGAVIIAGLTGGVIPLGPFPPR